jgi:hypothetical protein
MYVETGTEAYEAGRSATAKTMFLAARTEAEGFGSNDVRLASTLFWLARVYNAEQNDSSRGFVGDKLKALRPARLERKSKACP